MEKDEGVQKLGGESSKSLALEKMLSMATTYFSLDLPIVVGVWDQARQDEYHAKLEKVCKASRLQVVGAPLNVIYEEGTPDGTAFGSNFFSKLTLSVGRVSVREIVRPDCFFPKHDVDLLKFFPNANDPLSTSSDFKFTFEARILDSFMT